MPSTQDEGAPGAGPGYFNSYEDLSVHETMLRDRPRQEAYREAIRIGAEFIKDKVVLDVGAGTGILSVMCAQAGAKRVFAVEASNVAHIANQVVIENNVAHIVEVFQQRIEDFELPEGYETVDVIISEWMGFYLLHEGMLESFIEARDRFLEPEQGLVFPATATITLAPCSVPTRFADWDNVDGVRMQSLARAIRQQQSSKPEVMQLPAEALLHSGMVVSWLDLRDVRVQDVEEIRFREVIVCETAGNYQGVAIWFDVEFPVNSNDDSVVLSTSPLSPETHWKQSVIVLPEDAQEEVEVGEALALQLVMRRSQANRRQYNLELELLDADEERHLPPCKCIMTKCILARTHLERWERDEVERKRVRLEVNGQPAAGASVAVGNGVANGHGHGAAANGGGGGAEANGHGENGEGGEANGH